jgi:hypothetical protein
MAPDLDIVPANEASWEDLQAVFGTRGDPSKCYCQRFKLRAGEAFSKFPAEERAHRLRSLALRPTSHAAAARVRSRRIR